MEKFDVVAKPSHYAEGRKYEPKDVIRDWGLNFNLGSAVKYISRAGRKDDILQDLKKAKQFLEFEIDAIGKERTADVETSCWEEAEHVVFPSEEDAEEALNDLNNIIDVYGFVYVSDFYDIVGLSYPFEDHIKYKNYGWKNLSGISPKNSKDLCSYYLPLPKPEFISPRVRNRAFHSQPFDSAAKMTVRLNANASTWIPTDEEQRKLLLITNQKWFDMVVETNGYCTLASIIDTLGFDSFPKHSFYGFVKGGERVVLDYDPKSEFITITANRLPEN